MIEKEIILDGASMLNGLFACDLVNNLKILQDNFKAKIVARDNWIRISSENLSWVEEVRLFIEELVKIYESGHVIRQKDFELSLSSAISKSKFKVKDLYSEAIKVSPKKNTIVPRTINQCHYIQEIKNRDVIFGIGPAGTGKTYLAMAMAISYFLTDKCNRIVLTRPAMEAGENLGFLPGTLEEKIKPYLRPLYDALYEMLDFDEANKLIESNVIEVAPLAFMRGRTLNNSFIILDEAQNTTVEQMKMLLTRIGLESKCVVTGDPSQTDLPQNKESGLNHAYRILRNIPEVGFLEFSHKDVVRNKIVEKIIIAYEKGKRRAHANGTKSKPVVK